MSSRRVRHAVWRGMDGIGSTYESKAGAQRFARVRDTSEDRDRGRSERAARYSSGSATATEPERPGGRRLTGAGFGAYGSRHDPGGIGPRQNPNICNNRLSVRNIQRSISSDLVTDRMRSRGLVFVRLALLIAADPIETDEKPHKRDDPSV